MPVSVVDRRGRLYLQATLPAKAHSRKVGAHQQRIACSLPANKNGLQQAERMALALGADLLAGRFDWANWGGERTRGTDNSTGLIKAFEQHYRSANAIEDRSWHYWQLTFSALPQDRPIKAADLLALALSKPAGTRIRQQTCDHLQRLADFAGLDIDIRQYRGDYGPANVKARDLPDDELIEQVYQVIPNAQWRLIYGLIAAYGLRPHEAFFCHFNGDELEVEKGKTGPRTVFSCVPPHWVSLWGLRESLATVGRPPIDAEAAYLSGTLGKKIAAQFGRRRYDLPFQAYDLRHAWAIRCTVVYGIPERVTAQMMGHSVDQHLRCYNRWLSVARGRDIALSKLRPQPD